MKRATRSKTTARTSGESLKVADDDRKVGKRKAAAKPVKSSKRVITKKAKKDPNKPKRAPSAFFVFLEEFRKTFKKENPTVKAVSAVGKAAGLKWKSMTKEEKSPYAAKAAGKQAEYEKQIKDYNLKQKKESVADAVEEEEESDTSKSELEEATAEEDEDDGDDDDDDDEDY